MRSSDLRGAAIALRSAVVGFAPWIAYNVATHLGSLSSLSHAAVHHGTRQAATELFVLGIPVFLGAEHLAGCGTGIVPWVVADVAMVALLSVTIWLRRRSVLALLQLRWTRLAPIDFVLLLLPLTLLSVIVGPFNGAACDPRYLMPAAVPLVVIVALAIAVPWRGRWPFAAAADKPSWIFLQNDADRPIFEKACASRGITYDRSFLSGLVLYDHLSARLTPDEFGWLTTINP